MVRSYIISIMCITMLTSNLLFGGADSVKDHKKHAFTASVAALATSIYGTHKQIRHAVNKRIALLKNYYYTQAQQPITRAQALTTVTVGMAGLGVYFIAQKVRSAHE